MCFAENARPPIPELAENLGAHQDLVLTSADGTRFMAYQALPRETVRAGILILPDVRGLHDYYRALAQRVAEHGLAALAIDYYGRTAGIGDRGDDFVYKPHREGLDPDAPAADIGAAIGSLRAVGVDAVVTLGFCFGGGQSWRQGALQAGLAGAIGFYGRPVMARDVVDRMRAPLLILAAGADMFISQADYADFDAALTAAGVEHEMHSYAGAPHSFFDRTFAEHADACADAWERIRGFVSRHARVPVSP